MSTVRFATVNVYSFRQSGKYESNIDDLVSIFEPLGLDFIGVQEIQNNNRWTDFASRLGLNHQAFGNTRGGFFCNGIASRHEISFSKNEIDLYGTGGSRGLLQCSFQNYPGVKFGVTHLDHITEEDRLAQITQFQPVEEHVDILMGDMNALTREDYSDEYYQTIVEGKRRESRWEAPRFELTSLLTSEWKYHDVFRLLNPRAKDAQVETCAYGTRIDYVYFHARLMDRCTVKQCQIIQTNGATDHNAVFVECTFN